MHFWLNSFGVQDFWRGKKTGSARALGALPSLAPMTISKPETQISGTRFCRYYLHYSTPPPFFCLLGKASHVSQLLLTECCNQSWHQKFGKSKFKNLKPISLWDFPYLKPRFRAPDLSLVATTYTIPPPFFCLFGKASHVSQLLLTECCNQSWHQVFFTRRWRTQSSSQTSIWPSS